MLETARHIIVEFDLPAPPARHRIRRVETHRIEMDFEGGRDRVNALIANCR